MLRKDRQQNRKRKNKTKRVLEFFQENGHGGGLCDFLGDRFPSKKLAGLLSLLSPFFSLFQGFNGQIIEVIFDELLGFSSPPSPIDKGEKKKGKKEKKEKKKGKKERKKGFEEEAEKEGEKSKRVLVTNGDWSDFQVVATSGNRRPIVSLRSGGTICPHFVLVRKLVDKLVDSYRNALFGLLLSQV